MTTTYLACAILVFYIIVAESFGRAPGKARQFRVNNKWQTHTLLYVSGVTLGLALAPILNIVKVGYLSSYSFVGWIGIVLLLAGLVIRVTAISALGEFHTRSLMVQPGQSLVCTGIYKYIRHPGYLGTIVGGTGFALSTTNWIIIVYTITFLVALFVLRISAEEKMLTEAFGKKYREYSSKTKRLIPFIY